MISIGNRTDPYIPKPRDEKKIKRSLLAQVSKMDSATETAAHATDSAPIDEFDVPAYKHPRLISKLRKAFGKLPRRVTLIEIEDARVRLLGDLLFSIKSLVSFDNEITPCHIQLNESRYKNTETIDVTCPEKNYHAVISKENPPCESRCADIANSFESLVNNWDDIGDLVVKSLIEIGRMERIYYGLVKMTDVQCVHNEELTYVVKAKLIKPNFKVINCELEIINRPSSWNVVIYCQKNVFNVCKDKEEPFVELNCSE